MTLCFAETLIVTAQNWCYILIFWPPEYQEIQNHSPPKKKASWENDVDGFF